MKPTNVLSAALAGAIALSSCSADDPASTDSVTFPPASDIGPAPDPTPGPVPLPMPITGYVVAELPPRAGGSTATVHAIGSDGRAVGEAEGCVFYLGQIHCGVVAVYWDPGQAPTVIPQLAGTTSNKATGITDAGVIVGASTDGSGHRHGWRWSAATGTTEMFSPVDGTSLIFNAATAGGWTTGIHFPPGKLGAHAFRYHLFGGAFQDLFPPCVRTLLNELGLQGSIPPGHPVTDCLNDSEDLIATRGASIDAIGNVAGQLQVGVGQSVYAYFWPGVGGAVNLRAMNPSVDAKQATAVNGSVLGPYLASDGSTRAYSWSGLSGGGLGDMGLSIGVFPNGLSNMGRLVGHSSTGNQRAVTWYANKVIYLGVPGGMTFGDAVAVNRCGNVVGNAQDAAFKQRAFRWTKTGCD